VAFPTIYVCRVLKALRNALGSPNVVMTFGSSALDRYEKKEFAGLIFVLPEILKSASTC
jgi:hypothetical protein